MGLEASGQPTLVVPDGWVVDEVVHERLDRQLARAPIEVVGVVAETGELPSGSSYRVHAERLACAPLSIATERRSTAPRTVALVRPDVRARVRGDRVEVDRGLLLVDPGSHAHDPSKPPGDLAPASPLGRPPFPCRPVVVFLAREHDDELLDWARELVNGLVRADVEARLAVPTVAEGLHLTRPSQPVGETLDALAPDVVVALDRPARQTATASRANQSLVVVELLSDLAGTFELVSWQRGRASGRVRARIGRRIDAPSLARLVNRLCAGPHPLAPSDQLNLPTGTWTPGVESRAREWSPTSSRTLTVICDKSGPSARIEGLIGHLQACGVTVEMTSVGHRTRPAGLSADLLLLDATVRSDAAAELASTRRAAGRATVADLGPADLALDAERAEGMPSLQREAAGVATAAGAVTSAAPAVLAAARRLGVRAQLVPMLLTRARAVDLRRTRTRADRWSQPIVAWSVGAGPGTAPELAAVGAALLEILAERQELRVTVIGERDRVPTAVLRHGRVMVTRDPDPETIAAWAAHLWTPRRCGGEIADDLRSFIEASCAGVPSMFSARVRNSIEGYVARDLVVDRDDEPSGWLRALRWLLDDRRLWDRRSDEARRRADALYESAASVAVANRFLGWAQFESGS